MSINVVFSKKPESDPIYTGPNQQFPISPRPVVWDRDNTVYVGNPGSTHWDLHQEFTDSNSGDFDEGYVMDRRTNDLFASDSIDNEVWWKGEGGSAEFSGEFGLGEGDPHQQEIGDAILEALGGTNTFMSKRLGSSYAAPEGKTSGWNDVMHKFPDVE